MIMRRRGLGQPPVPAYAQCDPRDTACVNANETLNTNYDVAMQTWQAQNNYDQCQQNAQNALPGAQMDAVLAACSGQFATQAPGAVVQPYTPSGSTPPPPPQPSYGPPPQPPAPPQQVVVNPSPPSQSTATGTSITSPGSVLSQANGTTLTTAATTTGTDWIAGIPNDVVLIGGGIALFLLMMMGKR